MRLIDRLSRIIKISENTKTVAKTIISLVAMILSVVSTANFIVGNKLTSIERIQQKLFIFDNRIELQKILKQLAEQSKADRAFFIYYDQSKDGEMVAVFKKYYQWQPEGQADILEQKYSIKKGADTARLKAMEAYKCHEIVTKNLSPDDELAIALKKSNVTAQIACPVIDVFVDGEYRLGVLSLEFEEQTYDRTIVEANLLVGAADVLESFETLSWIKKE